MANSQAGAEDYASWLGLPLKDFRVIRNGLAPEAVVRPTPEEAALFRKELGLSKDDLLVGGVFRLDPEKRPLDFLKVIKKIRDRDSRVKAVIAGQGTLSRWLGKEVRRMGLEDHVFLLGRREDVPGIMAACQVILLTSAYEGTPNVLIEAQWLGLPVVATRAGGIGRNRGRQPKRIHPRGRRRGLPGPKRPAASGRRGTKGTIRAGRKAIRAGNL